MTFWWMQPGWTDATCGQCGAKIYPEGDPDWGLCWPCMNGEQERQQQEAEQIEAERIEMERREIEEHFRKHPHG